MIRAARLVTAFAPLLLAACAAPIASVGHERGASVSRPPGATIEASGFATLLAAPPVPHADSPPPPAPETEPARIARTQGIPLVEAERRMNPDGAARQAAIVLHERLKVGAPGNYIGMRIVRDPDPRYAFQFRRDAAATIAWYTRDPRFIPREGGVPEAELQPIFDAWWPRLQAHRLVGGGAVDAFDGVVRFDMNIDKVAFEEIAATEGWTLPDRLALNFAPPPNPRSVDTSLASLVRIFPREDRLPAFVHSAALSGRVILRDGCFRLTESGGEAEPLVIFGRDSELTLDADGYMVVRNDSRTDDNRADPPRIGERVVWSGPRSTSEAGSGLRALRAACGDGPVVAVGEPVSAHAFRVRPWEIDAYAREAGISRQAAWEALKACWARLDASPERAVFYDCPRPVPSPMGQSGGS